MHAAPIGTRPHGEATENEFVCDQQLNAGDLAPAMRNAVQTTWSFFSRQLDVAPAVTFCATNSRALPSSRIEGASYQVILSPNELRFFAPSDPLYYPAAVALAAHEMAHTFQYKHNLFPAADGPQSAMPCELHADYVSGLVVALLTAFEDIGQTPEAAAHLMFDLGDNLVSCCDHHGLDHQREAMFLQGFFQSDRAQHLPEFIIAAAHNMAI